MNSQLDWVAKLLERTIDNQDNWVAKLPELRQAQPWQEKMRASGNFYCLLDEQPDNLVPERFKRAALATDDSTSLIINPFCWFSDEGLPPLEIATRLPLLNNFLLACHSVWVGNPVTGMYIPFEIGPEYSALLQEIRAGKLAIQDLPTHIRVNLVLAGIVITRDFIVEQQKAWANQIAQANTHFKDGKYATLQDLFPPLLIGALRKYYRRLIQEGYLKLGDTQCPLRYYFHNESVTRFFHDQLTGIISYVVGAPVKPSYVYFGAYQGGAELDRHTDRPQCEYTLTLCIDYSPEPEKETPWPIYVETPDGIVATYQSIGDGLLFKGRELPHYREKLNEGSSSTSIFFHYVDMNFQDSLS